MELKKVARKSCGVCAHLKRIETPLEYDENSESCIGGTIFKCLIKDTYVEGISGYKCRYFQIKEGYMLHEERSWLEKIINKIRGN